LIVTVGAGTGGGTLTVTDWVAVPPAPLQVRMYVVVAVRPEKSALPLVGRAPVQPPEATHELALLATQSSRVPPGLLVTGVAVSEMEGVGGGTTTTTNAERLTDPPGPVQVRSKDELAVRLPVVADPLTGLVPLQLPNA
jgi:hypothetical protein